jgi:glycosyltransferase involved in cell wall biosynthesis
MRTAVLLATYNGEAYLAAQLESLAAQGVGDLDVWASDDGSTDGTQKILRDWACRWPKGRFELLQGPRRGFAANFVSLLQNEAVEADYFAFSDQDDLWDPDKLVCAIAWMESEPASAPRAYGGRTRLVSADGARVLGLSPLFSHQPDFRNAIVQSIAGGNTMVVDRAARELLARSTRRADIVAHDWWTYIIVTGAGGRFRYDPEPGISYRQHGGNAIGSNDGWRARMERLRRMLRGVFREWNETNFVALSANADLLSGEARQVLERFQAMRTSPLPSRLSHLRQSGIFRQTRLGNLGLYVACALGRV